MLKLFDISLRKTVDPMALEECVLQGFPHHQTVYCGQTTHGDLVQRFIQDRDAELASSGAPPLSAGEKSRIACESVRMFAGPGSIRIVVENLESALAIDKQLQELVPRDRIRFMDSGRLLLKAGLCWRCCSPPTTVDGKRQFVRDSENTLSSGLRVFHAPYEGTRYITVGELQAIRAHLPEKDLFRAQLSEVHALLWERNRRALPELCIHMCRPRPKLPELAELVHDLAGTGSGWQPGEFERATSLFDRLMERVKAYVPAECHEANYASPVWIGTMYEHLIRDPDHTPNWAKELSAEFWYSISWQPGARMERGAVHYDPEVPEIVRGLIAAYSRRCGDRNLEYINIGSLKSRLRRAVPGEWDVDRWVGVAILKYEGQPRETFIIRKEKWGVLGRLLKGETQNVAGAQARAAEYSNYIALRLEGLRLLEYPVPPYERIDCQFHVPLPGDSPALVEESFWHRPYVAGVASDKIPVQYYGKPGFAARLAGMLGHLAGRNIVLGRTDSTDTVRFDDGDEVVVLAADGLPEAVVVADLPGSFFDYEHPLSQHIPESRAVLDRMLRKADRQGLCRGQLKAVEAAFVDNFRRGFNEVRDYYLANRAFLDGCFTENVEVHGHFDCRWHAILNRLAATAADPLVQRLAVPG
jgi:hypothetical protein